MLHYNGWETVLSAASQFVNLDFYGGSLPGDSGGGLIRSGSNPNNPFNDLLCGTVSGHYLNEICSLVPFVDPIFIPFVLRIDTVTTSVWSAEAENFLRPHIIDSGGNIRGTCSSTIPTSPAMLALGEDTDSDGDTIPDACDPCPGVYDATYIRSGVIGGAFKVSKNVGEITLADRDGDQVPDVCDVCPSRFDPAQADSDQDGMGDVCDACGVNGGISDLFCCQVGGLATSAVKVSSAFRTFLPFKGFQIMSIFAARKLAIVLLHSMMMQMVVQILATIVLMFQIISFPPSPNRGSSS